MAASGLAEAVAGRDFVVTAECGPRRGVLGGHFSACATALRGSVHAILVPETAEGLGPCSLAGCSLLASAGADPILNLLTRDLNRIALQATILGAWALGVRHVLCTSGRHQALTNSPQARGVFGIDPIQLLRVADAMRKDGRAAGDEPQLEVLLGTDTNPFAEPSELQVLTLEKAVSAGADFVITQPVFNIERFSLWADRVREFGIQERTWLIAAVMPLTSAGEAADLAERERYLDIPAHVIETLEAAPDQRSAGIELAAATIARLREVEGVRGTHVVTGADFALAADVLRASGLSRSE